MKRKWVEYNERLDDYLANTNKIESISGKENELLSILLDELTSKRQESKFLTFNTTGMEETRTPVTSQQEDYSSEQNCDEDIWFGTMGDAKINCKFFEPSASEIFEFLFLAIGISCSMLLRNCLFHKW
jgi:hypothetical protein